jgi:CSLREA domain-containing protein
MVSRLLGWLTAVMTLLVVTGEARAAFPGPNGPIVFMDAEAELSTVGPDGGQAHKLLTGDVAQAPSYSPDGTRIAYQSTDQPYTIGTVGADGTGAALIGRPGLRPQWNGDGRIVYSGLVDGEYEVMIVNADGTGAQALTSTPGVFISALEPVGSPDGSTVYFNRSIGNNASQDQIWSVPAAGGAPTPVLSGTGDYSVADVSPDGTKLLYVVMDGATRELRLHPLGGGPDTIVATGPTGAPRFSPDGTKIIYLGYVGGYPAQLRQVNVDGTNDHEMNVIGNPANGSGGRYYGLSWGTTGITVTETTDETDAAPGDAICDIDLSTAGPQCTLRAAIERANAASGKDKIVFDIDPGGRQTISVTSALPDITGPVEIDATTQPGRPAGEPGVAVDGSGAGNVDGLRVLGEGSTLRGLDVHGFAKSAVVLAGEGGHALEGSWIGFKRGTGGWERDGNGSGVDVAAPDVTVGGATEAERNVISANGNPAGVKAFVDGLSGDVAQGTLHDTFAAYGTGIVISDDDAARVDITHNWLGLDPDGGRFGAADGLTSTFGVMVGPEGGILSDVEITDNVISGNLFGVLAIPDAATAGVVDGLRIAGNTIGATPAGSAGPGLGGLFGVALLNHVANAEIDDNKIQGQVIGIAAARAAPRITDNDIGVDASLGDMVSGIRSGNASLGLHNLVGVTLADTQSATLGGAGADGNQILGNALGVIVAGAASADNAVLGNTIGLATDPGTPVADRTVADAGSGIGVLLGGGTGNDIGDADAGNVIQATGIGIIANHTTGGHVQGNRLNANAIGILGAQTSDLLLGGGGPAAGNELTRSAIGALLAGWSPTATELAATQLGSGNPVRREDRELALVAPQAQGALGFVDATSAATLDGEAVALDAPPGGVTAGLAAAPTPRATTATGTRLAGNAIGVTKSGDPAPNYVGAWLHGTHVDASVVDNTIARNYGGGLWIGSPVVLGSAVPEPTGVTVRANRIFENFSPGNSLTGVPALGLDLLEPRPEELLQQAFGVTAADAGDTDGGANGRQNAPIVTAAVRAGDQVTVSGTLSSKPSTTYAVELFANQRCSAFGAGEGELPVGGEPLTVTTGGDGVAVWSKTVIAATAYTRITATATGPEGTSELSSCGAIGPAEPAPPGPPGPGPAPGPGPGPPGPPGPPKDTKKPAVSTAGTSGKPKAGGPVTVAVTANEDATLTVTGQQATGAAGKGSSARIAAAKRIVVKLARVRTTVKAKRRVKVTLKPTGKADIKRLKRAVRRGAKATATVTLVVVDKAGNRTTKKLRIKLGR